MSEPFCSCSHLPPWLKLLMHRNLLVISFTSLLVNSMEDSGVLKINCFLQLATDEIVLCHPGCQANSGNLSANY